MTLLEAYDLFDFWRDWPPVNELLAFHYGWEKPMTTEEKIAGGAMGPEDFLRHYKMTGGKLPN